MKIILHSTNCPKCKVLKHKLNSKGISFVENLEIDVDDLLNRGFTSVPILQVDDRFMEFSEANTWIENQ